MITPTVGRIIWYKSDLEDGRFWPAMLCFINEDGTINIGGHDHNGAPFQVTNVNLHQGPSEECDHGAACWMPYQQAKQVEEDAKTDPAQPGAGLTL